MGCSARWQEWFSRALAAGRLPLWCPSIFADYPIVADGEIGISNERLAALREAGVV